MKLESHQSAADKARWKIVRRDTFAEVPGQILSADEDTGKCSVSVSDGNGGTTTQELDFGPGGMAIVGRGR